MTLVTTELLRRIPKAELHCHLDGSLRPSTMLDLARDSGAPMPADDAEALAEHMHVDDARNLEQYLERFDITLSVMQTREALERVAYELAEDAAREGVRYLETRFAPILNTRHGLTLHQVVEATLAGLRRAEREYDMVARVIVCGLRNLPPEVSLAQARVAVDFRGSGVAGFDLAGGEKGFPASDHQAAFDHAIAHGLPCTCHAGEGDGAESVRDAITRCHACRIGHGTRLIEDAALTEQVRAQRIAVECCLTSNVQTHAVERLEDHPVREYFDRGLLVTLNTDNRLMSRVTLLDEYALAARTFGFDFDEMVQLARNSFQAGFLTDAERAPLQAAFEVDVATLRAELAR